jgi:hypothetical protein
MQKSTSDSFYADLAPVARFGDCLNDQVYTPAPSDWTVLISDVRDSTAAIAEGRYKAVNMVGAATITAVLDMTRSTLLPFLFGGDGATILVPPSLRDQAIEALVHLRDNCRQMFDLDLRVGAIPVADILAAGHRLAICKYELSPGNYLGFLAGTGHAYATERLKDPSPDNVYLLDRSNTESDTPPDLSGLSCRWQPLQSRRGCMVTLVIEPVEAPGGDGEMIDRPEINAAISEILGEDMGRFAPVSLDNMHFSWPPSGLALEAGARSARHGRLGAIVSVLRSSLAQLIAERLGIRLGPYDPKRYHAELLDNTDYRKLDGPIRLVLDVAPAQADAIAAYLETEAHEGRLHFGQHRSDAALMTCLVFDIAAGNHIHFIDGAGGGHTLAALDMKRKAG